MTIQPTFGVGPPVGNDQRKTEIGNFNGATIPFLTLVTWARTKALADEQAMGPLNVKTFSII